MAEVLVDGLLAGGEVPEGEHNSGSGPAPSDGSRTTAHPLESWTQAELFFFFIFFFCCC